MPASTLSLAGSRLSHLAHEFVPGAGNGFGEFLAGSVGTIQHFRPHHQQVQNLAGDLRRIEDRLHALGAS